VISEFLQLKNTDHKSNVMLLDSVSSDMIIAESKNISNQHTSNMRGNAFFLVQSQVLTFCIKFVSHRLPGWDPSWSCHGLLLLQKDEHPLHFLESVNQPQMHFLPTWSPLPKLQSLQNFFISIL